MHFCKDVNRCSPKARQMLICRRLVTMESHLSDELELTTL